MKEMKHKGHEKPKKPKNAKSKHHAMKHGKEELMGAFKHMKDNMR